MRGLIMIGLIVVVGIHTGNTVKCPVQDDLSVLNADAFCNFYMYLYSTLVVSKFCLDGSYPSGFYCGVGSCNIFGYNCDGGCKLPSLVSNYRFYNKDICDFALSRRDQMTDDYNRCVNKQISSDRCSFHIHKA